MLLIDCCKTQCFLDGIEFVSDLHQISKPETDEGQILVSKLLFLVRRLHCIVLRVKGENEALFPQVHYFAVEHIMYTALYLLWLIFQETTLLEGNLDYTDVVWKAEVRHHWDTFWAHFDSFFNFLILWRKFE